MGGLALRALGGAPALGWSLFDSTFAHYYDPSFPADSRTCSAQRPTDSVRAAPMRSSVRGRNFRRRRSVAQSTRRAAALNRLHSGKRMVSRVAITGLRSPARVAMLEPNLPN